ncbi:SH2B adaptor protein 3 [Amia ocellicauda]|uniref:SH2B adaptor protein 3 n=1 Tax=Amia ocellicauda TaxID=2972642 RepID=UPI0034645AD0|nr:SH2B3 protein [Amia calva]
MNGNTIQQGTTSPSVTQPRGWKEFCELHAISTARELAKQYRRFASEYPQHDVLAAENFSKQFTDLFQQYFRNEVVGEGLAMTTRYRITSFSGAQDYRVANRRLSEGNPAVIAVLAPKAEPLPVPREQERNVHQASTDTTCPPRLLPRSRSSEEDSDGALSTSERHSPSPSAAASTTHFSMSQIRHSVRRLFKRESLESVAAAGSGDMRDRGASGATEEATASMPTSQRWFDRLANRIRPRSVLGRGRIHESCKEGHLKYLMVDDTILDTQPRWQRCKLLVRKTRGMGSEEYQLELFDPPKGSSPKLRAPCSDITEIRRCNRLEMPDNMNTFVLKVNHVPGSFIFETDNDQQVSSWTTELKECIKPGPDSADVELLSSPLSDVFPPVRRGSSESMNQGVTHFGMAEQIYHKTDHFLSSYPWFHGPISRVKAAQLVQGAGPQGHGVFLVRQSETRRGDYVLTFNFQGKAKHLRLSVTDRGHCRVQHLRFPSVVDMLNHFRVCPIPLECGTACDVKLSSYVVASCSAQGLHRWSSEPNLAHVSMPGCPRVPLLDTLHPPPQRSLPQEEALSAGPWRAESVGTQPPHHGQHRDSDYELEPPDRGRRRAVDNQYMFL